MKIGKIKLNDGGLSGMKVCYLKPHTRGGFTYLDEYEVNYKSMIHSDLKDLFKSLVEYLIDICCLSTDVQDQDVEITGMVNSDKGFMIMGKVRILDNAIFALNTPLINDEAGYSEKKHKKVLELMDSIYKETAKYILQDKIADKKQYAFEFNDKKQALTQKELESMSDKEIEDFCRRTLEEKGAIVISESDRHEESEEEIKPIVRSTDDSRMELFMATGNGPMNKTFPDTEEPIAVSK